MDSSSAIPDILSSYQTHDTYSEDRRIVMSNPNYIVCNMLGICDILCSLVLCIPSCRNIPLLLKQLSALARCIKFFLQRTASDMRGAANFSARFVSSTNNYIYGISSIPWNNLVSSYPVGFA